MTRSSSGSSVRAAGHTVHTCPNGPSPAWPQGPGYLPWGCCPHVSGESFCAVSLWGHVLCKPPNLPCVVPHHHHPPLQPLKSYLALAFRGDSGHASVPSRSPRPGSLTRLCLRGERRWTSAGVRAVVGSQISYRARKEGSGINCDRGGLSVSR